MNRHVAKLALLGAFALHGCSIDDASSTPTKSHASRLRIRLAVADLHAPTMTFYDVADREVVGHVMLDAPAGSVVASQSGDTALVVPKNGGKVQVLGSGVAVIPHKDHIHIFKSAPEVLGSPIAGKGPAAFAFAEGKWGIFFEGDPAAGTSATALALTEEPWVQGTRVPVDVAAPTPHRGITIPFAGEYLVSRPPASGGTVAGGVDFIAAGSTPQPLFNCPEMTAAATSGRVVAFACAGGVVLLGSDRIPSAPVALPENLKPSLLNALAEQPFLLGRDPAGRVFGLELATRSTSLLPLDGEACDAVLEIGTTPRGVVLTSAGHIERFELATKDRRTTTAAVPAFACSDPERPRLAATPGRAWVTSPATGEILELDTDAGTTVRRIFLGGAPGSIAILGLDARDADLSTGNDELTD
ncbi:MAG: hypothetical protein KF850_04085 [Labilithrix sp.]|nr:hypothetical protein [Labilithrix sp.]MBX3211189.1 hypothetical protein [Labilithrix sp.]